MKELVKKLSEIQKELKAPKSQFNKFGNYKYRNQEDILEAVKKLLNGLVLTISDDATQLGDRFYIKATASITDGENTISVTAYAREPDEQKGMSDPQLSGSTSSYARKYALNGLFLIDDTKDPDTDEYTEKTTGKSAPEKSTKPLFVKKEDPKQENKVVEKAVEKKAEASEKVVETKQEVVQETKPKTGWASKRTKAAQASEDGY